MSAVSSTSTLRTSCPSGPVWWVTSFMPRICPASCARLLGVLASLTPPPLPRPPAWICALTTHRPPSSSQSSPPRRRFPPPCPWGSRPRTGAGSPWPDTRGSSRQFPPRKRSEKVPWELGFETWGTSPEGDGRRRTDRAGGSVAERRAVQILAQDHAGRLLDSSTKGATLGRWSSNGTRKRPRTTFVSIGSHSPRPRR